LEGLPAGSVVEVRADDPVTRRDLPGWAREMGHELLETVEEPGSFRFVIRKGNQ
jgi:tRNA 2-thiouridine synthesizing protein A